MNFREQIEEVKPREIEERSFAIISEELGARTFAPHTELIVKRCIHTSADFDTRTTCAFRRTRQSRQWKPSNAAYPS